jgi:hypothetical protein
MMQLVGGADVEGIDRAIREQRINAVPAPGNTGLGREPGGGRGIAARQGLAVGLGADRIDHPFPGDRARPDPTPALSFMFLPRPPSGRTRQITAAARRLYSTPWARGSVPDALEPVATDRQRQDDGAGSETAPIPLLHAGIVQGAHHVLHQLLRVGLRGPLLRHLAPPVHDNQTIGDGKDVG